MSTKTPTATAKISIQVQWFQIVIICLVFFLLSLLYCNYFTSRIFQPFSHFIPMCTAYIYIYQPFRYQMHRTIRLEACEHRNKAVVSIWLPYIIELRIIVLYSNITHCLIFMLFFRNYKFTHSMCLCMWLWLRQRQPAVFHRAFHLHATKDCSWNNSGDGKQEKRNNNK